MPVSAPAPTPFQGTLLDASPADCELVFGIFLYDAHHPSGMYPRVICCVFAVITWHCEQKIGCDGWAGTFAPFAVF